eukprot:TRINITY_DN27244_c0_g1_i2.p2 TRINITY_DN27244_c0_g1~~TRINITY_DN27244_c0_g1_i2.p2  ORF type:complete len:163 (+),score=15.80 TRINITY_DN27244_c0_g1_i2:246-734(+)
MFASAGSDSKIIIWDTEFQKQLFRYDNEFDSAISKISGMGTGSPFHLVACSKDRTIKIFDTRIQKSTNTFPKIHNDAINTIVYQQQNQLIFSGSDDCSIFVWDVRKLALQNKFQIEGKVKVLTMLSNQNNIVIGQGSGLGVLYIAQQQLCLLYTSPSPRDQA